MTEPEKRPVPQQYRRFEELAKRLLRVSKKDVEEKEAQRPKRTRKPST